MEMTDGQETRKNLLPKTREILLQKVLPIARYLLGRIVKEDLPGVAGNITYTMILGLVPAFAVALAIFTKLPQFQTLNKMLEIYFTRGMIPPGMAQGITQNLTLFASKAARVSIVGAIAMVFTTAMMFDLIEKTFNRIWGVQEPRPILRRILLYIVIAVVGPVIIGASLYLSSHIYLAGRGVVAHVPYFKGIWSGIFLSTVSTVAFTLLYRYFPYRQILWKDAFWGAIFAAITFEIGKRLFAVFVMQFASYQKIYGAIALIPMFLLWLYVSSLIMLLGALITSSLPDIRSGRWNRVVLTGSQFSHAIAIIGFLREAAKENTTLTWTRLQEKSSLGSAEQEGILLAMEELGWVEHIEEHPSLSISKKKISRAQDEWRWIGDETQVTLADVYRCFVYQRDKNDPLSVRVCKLINRSLSQTLADYFAELEKSEEPPAVSAIS